MKVMKEKENINSILHYLNLDAELDDFDKIHDQISKDIVFKGTNLWILIFAIVLASVGLNMNSTAVIIGAMLISPLMGPINGMGYSIATYNSQMFKTALKNFSFAVGASLLTSMIYFLLSPISTAHSELLARTSPTFYDVLIALFGGLAGIVAIISKQKGNVIPGVAIATALMPPLCTAGYGLATGQFNYFFGAFYLFSINTVFIAISSVLISRVLKFPLRSVLEPTARKKINQGLTFVISLMLIPSVYLGYQLVQKDRFLENAGKYIRNNSVFEGNFLLRHEIQPASKTLTLTFAGPELTDNQKNNLRERAKEFNLKDAKIEFQQGLSLSDFSGASLELQTLKRELTRVNLLLQEKELALDSLSYQRDTGKSLLKEIQSIYSEIKSCIVVENAKNFSATNEIENSAVVIFSTNGQAVSEDQKEKIKNWLIARIQNPEIKVFYE
jgi:uncharacterized hydrophobic protein (TIGR00271 family)